MVVFINNVQLLLKEICDENNIKFNVISNGWVMVFEKESKVRILAGYKFDLNKNGISNVFDDKFATYELLKLYDVPVVEHKLLYGLYNMEKYATNYKNYNYLLNYFYENNNNIVIKKNNGTCGNDVYHITNINELKKIFEMIKMSKLSYSMSPFYNIENEYRTIVLDGKIKLIHKKCLPIVYGDGKSTLKELLTKFNPIYFNNKDFNNSDYIPGVEEEYQYDWRFNLCNGATASFDIDDDVKEKLELIVNKITSLFDIGFCSIDIIKTKDNHYYVLEINSGVMMSNLLEENSEYRKIIKDIYKVAIEMQFML